MKPAELQFALGFTLGDPGKGAQVSDRQTHHRLFGGALQFVRRDGFGDVLNHRRALRDPGGHEVGDDVRRAVDHGVDPAAVGVAHDDYAFDAQNLDPELQGRRNPVQLAVRFIGRNQIGDVADDEQLARLGVEDQGRIGAAVGTGDDQGVRLLALFGQGFVLGVRLGPVFGAEAAVA